MADVKISELTALTTPDGAEELVVNDNGVTKKIRTDDLFAGDNVKAKFGTSNDLQIWHDGSNSYIKDSGTGDLKLQGNNFTIGNTADTKYFTATNGGSSKIYNAGSEKLATTPTGIDVTGTATMDGLTVEGGSSSIIQSTGAETTLEIKAGQESVTTGTSKLVLRALNAASGTNYSRSEIASVSAAGGDVDLFLRTTTDSSGPKNRIKIDAEGDISFYEDTGTTAKFFWDASAESLGIGTSSPTAEIEVNTNTSDSAVMIRSSDTGTANLYLGDQTGAFRGGLKYDNSNDSLGIYANGLSTADATIDSSGNVGIGTTSPTWKLTLASTNVTGFINPATSSMDFGTSGAHNLNFYTNSIERARIDSSGNLLVGTTAVGGQSGLSISPNATQGAAQCIFDRASTANNSAIFLFRNAGSQVGFIQYNNTSTVYGTSSDYRLKEDEQPMVGATDRVKALKPINFAWKADGSRVDGFLAHELAEVVPEAATGTKDAMRTEEYEISPALGEVFVPAVEASFIEVSPAVAYEPAYYDIDGNVIKPEVEAVAAVHEAVEAVAEQIISTDVEQPTELPEGQQWRETTPQVMGEREVPDYQGIDQSKLVPLLTAALQEALARIEALEAQAAS